MSGGDGHFSLKRANNGALIRFKHERRLAVGLGLRDAGGKQVLMEVDGVLRILQRVASQQQHDAFATLDAALRCQLLQSGERYCTCRFAADAFRADLGFCQGDFRFADLLAPAASRFDDAGRLTPACWVADADRRGTRVSVDRQQQLFGIGEPLKEWVRAFGLD